MIRLTTHLIRLGVIAFAVTVVAVLGAERYALSRYPIDALRTVDAVIVLGGGANPDSTQNYIGRRRADAAAAIVLSGRAEVAIPTGRLRDPEAPPLGEAILFAERMKALGVAEDSIVLEPNARTTLENLTLSFALGDARGFSRYAVVTDAFHLPRALALAALIGRDVEGVATDGFYDYGNFHRVGLILRESMAWWYNLGKAVAWIGLGALGWSVHDRREVVF